MVEEIKKLPTNMLSAEELLKNKGLKYNAWDEYEKSAKTLPKTGMKLFEPNNSWLENMQIEKGIMTRKNLISIERVDRISQLASAEWLPVQKRAKVIKYSGQNWSNFGLEKNGSLYLIPEEALFLLEANCLELTWNTVPLSIQQAYDLLIDNVECTLQEYRVYSHLVRHGYRIQRFIYNSENSYRKVDESNNIKRKVIVEPGNGLWMTDKQQQDVDTATSNNSSTVMYQDVSNHKDILYCVNEIVEDLLCAVEKLESIPKTVEGVTRNVENHEKLDINVETVNIKTDNKKRKAKVEIISEEILLSNIKIVAHPPNSRTNGSNTQTNWQSSRTQRNVKLLPKRADKVVVSTDNFYSGTRSSEQDPGKHKSTAPSEDSLEVKKSKHEVIELSDDEIQEVPKPMSRMDLLNLIPNIAFQDSVTIKISRGYIPHSVKPCKTSYHYEIAKLRNLTETDKRFRSVTNLQHSHHSNNRGNRTVNHKSNNTSTNKISRSTSIAPFNQNFGTNVHHVSMENYYAMHHGPHTNFGSYGYTNRMPYAHNQNLCWEQSNTTFQNVFLTLDNYSTAVHQNRYTTVQTDNIPLPNTSSMIRHFFTRNHSYHNFHQNNMPFRRLYHQSVVENVSMQSNVAINELHQESRHHRRNRNVGNHKNEINQSTFKVLPGASSWSELKTQWREEKTITIDDEEPENDEVEDCNEVQVVGQSRSPLVGSKNANSLEEAFNKLKIIKSAPEKTVRRKRNKYKISYNIYSNAQNFRKANPGLPFYRVVVIRQDDPFMQPIELQRLLQDAGNSPIVLACVAMSISYIQPGFISTPNMV